MIVVAVSTTALAVRVQPAAQDTTVAPAAQGPQTSGGAAYVPRAGGPPDTSAYMWAGYAVGLVVYGWYIALLLRRHARERAAARPRA